jgi:hypothetical protein
VGVRTEEDALAEIVYLPRRTAPLAPTNALAERVCAQIEKYVADPGFRFRLPMKDAGTAFQRSVWNALASIPCGQTRTYGDIARRGPGLRLESSSAGDSLPSRRRGQRPRRFRPSQRRLPDRGQAQIAAA